jgi:hypothetical protein
MADHTVVSNDQPLSSVEIATRQKGPPVGDRQGVSRRPGGAAREALRIYEGVFTIGRDRFVQE